MSDIHFDSVIVSVYKNKYVFNFFDKYIDYGISGRGFNKHNSNIAVSGYSLFVLQEDKDFNFETFEDG